MEGKKGKVLSDQPAQHFLALITSEIQDTHGD